MNPYASLSQNVAVLSDITAGNQNTEHIRYRPFNKETFSQDLVRLLKAFGFYVSASLSVLAFGGTSDESWICVTSAYHCSSLGCVVC